MKQIVLIRHGPTDWNTVHRIQGRTDVRLSEEGRRTVADWTLPDIFSNHSSFCSPLRRTRETAAALGLPQAQQDAALIEMDWGEFEGERLSDLRERLGDRLQKNEDRGLDFRPPGGESPRDVSLRLRNWAHALTTESVVAVTHKGVIRSAMAMATGWDMRAKPPIKLRWEHAHVFRVDIDGQWSLKQGNVELLRTSTLD